MNDFNPELTSKTQTRAELDTFHPQSGFYPTSFSSPGTDVTIYPKKVIRFLSYLILGLIAGDLIALFLKYGLSYNYARGFVPLFDLNGEIFNIPDLYSAFSLLFCSGLLGVISLAKQQTGDRYTKHWKALAFIFLYLSIDEAVSLHERTIEPLRSLFHFSGIFYYAWVIPGTILFGVFVLSYLKFLRALPPRTRYGFIIAGSIYVGGALGLEMVGAWLASSYGEHYLGYELAATTEEGLEMFGILAFIHTLLTYIRHYIQPLRIQFTNQ